MKSKQLGERIRLQAEAIISHAKEIGIRWCTQQCEELLNNGVKNIHFYIMNGTSTVTEVLKQLNR